jgi:hypothetical protein
LTKPGELVELEQLKGFRVAAGDADPRGWTVVSCDDDAVGTVRTLLIDTALLKVRFLVCDLHPPIARAVVLPVSYARLDPDQKRLIFDLTHTETFGRLPSYFDVPPTKETEDLIHELVAGTTLPAPPIGESADRRKHDRRS